MAIRWAIGRARGEEFTEDGVARQEQVTVDDDHRLVIGSNAKTNVDIGLMAAEARKVADEDERDLPALDQMSDLTETLARAGMGAAYSEIVVDDLHTRGRPAPLPGLVSQPALQIR
jgi:hypothetical protein